MLYLPRNVWGFNSPLGPAQVYKPVRTVFVHHSVTNPEDDGVMEATGDVVADMKELERIGVSRFGRFSYSYCGHPSGVVAEGQGTYIGAHTAGYNSISLGYCLIGNYQVNEVPDAMYKAFGEWWWAMRYLGVIDKFTNLRFHKDVKATACPGQHTDFWKFLMAIYDVENQADGEQMGKVIGAVDIWQDNGKGEVYIAGWAADPDTAEPAMVHVYQEGKLAVGLVADQARADLASAGLPIQGINHGYAVTLKPKHKVLNKFEVYGIDAVGGDDNVLLGSNTVEVMVEY